MPELVFSFSCRYYVAITIIATVVVASVFVVALASVDLFALLLISFSIECIFITFNFRPFFY